MILPTEEMMDLFWQRNNRHIELVRLNLLSLVGLHGLTQEKLEERAANHDRSKFSNLEMLGYVWLTWEYHCRSESIDFILPEEGRRVIQKAMIKHRSVNRHHPEAHSKPDQMAVIDIVEMICDWHAISQENGKGPRSTRSWADENIGQKWDFSESRLNLIHETIEELEERNA